MNQAENPFEGTPYRAVRLLGAGGMGQVYEVEHQVVGKLMVAKLLRSELAKDAATVDRMRVEAQALARLDHPNIVGVSDFRSTADGRPFFVMERLTGCTVGEELRTRGTLPVEAAIDIARKVLGALSAAHGLGLVHRDIKPDNVFLHRSGTGERVVKVLDFGVAKVLAGHGGRAPAPPVLPTTEGAIVGTPRTVSPEQVLGKQVDERADIYGVGLLLYTLIAGRGPFDHVRGRKDLFRAHLDEDPEPPSKYARQPVPHELDAAILRALKKSPADRFQTAKAFEAALGSIAARRTAPLGWLETEPSPVPVPPAPPTVPINPTTTVSSPLPPESDATPRRTPQRALAVPTEVLLKDVAGAEVSTRTAPAPPAPTLATAEPTAPPPEPGSAADEGTRSPIAIYAASIAAAVVTAGVGLWLVEVPSALAFLAVLAASVGVTLVTAWISAKLAR